MIYRRPLRQIRFTKEGLEKLQKEYEELLSTRPSAVEELQKSRELGDLSENGFYKAARSKLSSLDSRLRRLSMQLKQATVIETQLDKVGIGNTVEVFDGKQTIVYHIVGDLEAAPLEGKISLLSPIGRALTGRKVGETVTIAIPRGTITYEILRIS